MERRYRLVRRFPVPETDRQRTGRYPSHSARTGMFAIARIRGLIAYLPLAHNPFPFPRNCKVLRSDMEPNAKGTGWLITARLRSVGRGRTISKSNTRSAECRKARRMSRAYQGHAERIDMTEPLHCPTAHFKTALKRPHEGRHGFHRSSVVQRTRAVRPSQLSCGSAPRDSAPLYGCG